ncbi:MAG: 1-acyl-sn-glycerol-3-phosphate acyltransferase [Gammaproteobacteria bacterium]|nr:1-acyl-sn-glycerol-3-phosphate acyltransferase [Gammaproteobacteria bacterium]MBT5222071.1 1-acyl-sn-glycerol-3-phosphate acyltransferase [Gammaproteobacteria bacterium]MBT5825652.1 1-acyl-sn-glycerol-3-phosphate acyltransferase [Gammaproteobacteria bacterium]MBT6419577.1 1-acyl-sn-glycerol-3-phosphate acyltransferase [Gammaproteobacteria bacterium]MBT6576939.1 1-acyl-sn-glycerol-3-phosphate acyltransferase [Gammaproteobacteria bacterium]
MIKYCWEWLLYLWLLVYWTVTSVSISVVGTVLYWLLPQKYAHICGRFILQKDFQLFIFILKITGLLILEDEQLRSLANKQEAMIVAPNHVALWDVVFIVARVPNLICIMKANILRNPLFGGGASYLAGYLPVRSITQMLKLAKARLKAGEQLLLFPEGTRTKTDVQWLNPLKGGSALLAKQAAVPVVPVFIRSNARFLEKGWPFYRKPDFPLEINISVGEPIIFAEGESVQEFALRLETIFIDELSRSHPLRRIQNNEL